MSPEREFRFGVDSTEDIWLYCDTCAQEIATGTSTWATDTIPSCKTLAQFVAVAASHQCVPRRG